MKEKIRYGSGLGLAVENGLGGSQIATGYWDDIKGVLPLLRWECEGRRLSGKVRYDKGEFCSLADR